MDATQDGHAIRGVLEAGSLQRVGSFRYRFDDGQWAWSDSVALMHGYQPGTVIPTTELLLSHKHPDDRARVAANLDSVRKTGAPFCSRHRIVDTRGTVHLVIVVGDQMVGDDGHVVGTQGFYVDITDATEGEVQQHMDSAIAEVITSRAAIDQAKGALMTIYGISADKAFELLTWQSQNANIKVRLLAEQLVRDLASGIGLSNTSRGEFDQVFLTAAARSKRHAAQCE